MAIADIFAYLEPWHAAGRDAPLPAPTALRALLARPRLDTSPVGVTTPYEQLAYLGAVQELAVLGGRALPPELASGLERAERTRVALRAGVARERRRDLALALLRAYRSAAEPDLERAADFLDLAIGLAARPFAVPPVVLGTSSPERRLDPAEFAALIGQLPARPYGEALLREVHAHLRRSPDGAIAAVDGALAAIFDARRGDPAVTDAATWLREVASLADAGARLRTVWAMYATPGGADGTALDLVVALLPRGGADGPEVRVEADVPPAARQRLGAVAAAALREAAAAVGARGDAWALRLWVHDLPGGTVGGPLDVESADSAGLPLVVACAAALTGRPIRSASASTGTIESGGRIGSVATSIPAKIGGLLGWLQPKLDADPADPVTFRRVFVPHADREDAAAAAKAVPDRVCGVASVKPDVVRLDDGPLDRPRLARYLADPLGGRGPRPLAPELPSKIAELATAVAGSASSTTAGTVRPATVLLPWWLPSDGDPLSALNPHAPLMLVDAGGVGDALLDALAARARTEQAMATPIFLNAGGAIPPAGHGWLADAIHAGVGPDEVDRSTVEQLLHEGAFALIVDADRLGPADLARVLEQQRSYGRCRWIFLTHATRAGAATYVRHEALGAETHETIDLLLPAGRNSSVWDRYLQRALGDLLKRFPTVKNEPGWLAAHFGSGRYAGTPIPRYLPRRLGAPQEPLLGEPRDRERKAPATLDGSAQGLFAARRAYPLEIVRAPSGRGKSFEVLASIVAWHVSEPRDKFAAAPLYLDAGLLPSLTEVLVSALNADARELAPAWSRAFDAIVAGEGLRESTRGPATGAARALGEALGMPWGEPGFWPLLLHGLGPTVLLLDGLREVPDASLRAERIVPNLIHLADLTGPWTGMPDGESGRSESRVVLLFRADVAETPFAREFGEALKQRERDHRVSELLPVDQEDATDRYLKPELEWLDKRPVLERLEQAWREDPQLLASFASDLRLLPAVTRLELKHLKVPIEHPTPDEIEAYDPDRYPSILKLALERRWDPEKPNEEGEKGDYVEVPVWRLYGGQILRWALIRDSEEGLRHEEDRRRDGRRYAIPSGLSREERRELVALGLLAFLATAKGQGVGQLGLAEAVPVFDRVFQLRTARGGYRWWVWEDGDDTAIAGADANAVHDAAARELERITGRVWVKGDRRNPEDWWLDFRHEEDRVLAAVWLIDYVLEHQDDPDAWGPLRLDVPEGGGPRTLQGLDLVRYAFALHDDLSDEEVNRRRSEWAAVYRLYEEASHKPRLLFELPEVRRRLGMDDGMESRDAPTGRDAAAGVPR